jgi:hypothetical protein
MTSDKITAQIGTLYQRIAVAKCPAVPDRMIQTSHPAMAAVAVAMSEKARRAQAVRFLNQMIKLIAASVRHAEAIPDQMTVTRLMMESIFAKKAA